MVDVVGRVTSGGQGRSLVGLMVDILVVKIDDKDEELSELDEVSLDDEVDEISMISVVDVGVEESEVLCSLLSDVVVVEASVTAVNSVDFVKSRTSTVVDE